MTRSTVSFVRIFRLVFSVGVAALIGSLAVPTAASPISLNTPTGLNTGDHFRFIFVTGSTTAATSSDITTYDTFVRNSVSSLYGNVTYGGSAITNWLAVGSTPTVNAKNHLGGYSSSVSVWLPNGTQVASSLDTATGGLWSGTLAHEIDQYLDGSSTNEVFRLRTWTGSADTGLAFAGYELGTNNRDVVWGVTNASAGGWMFYDVSRKTDSYAMFAVSPELIVQGAPTSVPEIDPAGMGSVLALVTGALGLLERRRLKGRLAA